MKKTIVFLPGLSFESSLWNKVIKFLPKDKSIEYMLLDFPHYGTVYNGSEVNFDYLSIFVKNKLKSKGIEQPYYFIGHSLGGLVALKFISNFPEIKPKHTLLVSTPLRNPNLNVPFTYKLLVQLGLRFKLTGLFLKYFFRLINSLCRLILPEEKYADFRDLYVFTQFADMKAIAKCFNDLFVYDFKKDVNNAKDYCQLIVGERDSLLHRVHGTDYYKLFAEDRLTIVKQNHSIPTNNPSYIAKKILEMTQ